jgi:4-hydroxy-3-methylbut-2-enyl diphosphate reductase
LIDDESAIEPAWLQGVENIGVTAGASAPEVLVERVIARLREWGVEEVDRGAGQSENVVFSLPSELKSSRAKTH